jgi:hypothetical protein
MPLHLSFVSSLDPHPEERRLRRVSKDEGPCQYLSASWFEMALRASSP